MAIRTRWAARFAQFWRGARAAILCVGLLMCGLIVVSLLSGSTRVQHVTVALAEGIRSPADSNVLLRLKNVDTRPVEILGVMVEVRSSPGQWTEAGNVVVDASVPPGGVREVAFSGMATGNVYRASVSYFYELRGLTETEMRIKAAFKSRRIRELWRSVHTQQSQTAKGDEFTL